MKTIKVEPLTHHKLKQKKIELNKEHPETHITLSDTIEELLEGQKTQNKTDKE